MSLETSKRIIKDILQDLISFILRFYRGSEKLAFYFNLQLIMSVILKCFAFMIALSGSISFLGIVYRRYKSKTSHELIL